MEASTWPLELDGFLPYRVARLAAALSRGLAAQYELKYRISVAEWRVLVHLARCHQVSVREIHDCVNLDKPRVSRAVTRLTEAGLVAKTGSATDQRLLSISLTDEGHALLGHILPRARAYEDRLMSGLTPAEQITLVQIMEKLHKVLDADPEARPRSRLDLPRDAAE